MADHGGMTRTTGPAGPAPARTAARARVATYVMFAFQAMLFASWTAHIPLVKGALALSDGELGLSLFGAPIGSVVATFATSWLLPRVGSRRMVQASLLGYLATAWLVGVVDSSAGLFGALLAWGMFQGSLDVSMNAQAVFVERAVGRPLMSGFHATWSLGGFTGAGLGVVAVSAGVALAPQLIGLAVVGLVIAGGATLVMLPDPAPEAAHESARPGLAAAWLHPAVVTLGLIVLASMLCEGAAADWSAVYLHESLGAAPGFAALAYTFYSAAMVTCRLAGDRLLARYSPRSLLPLLAAIATIGMLAGLLTGVPVVVIAGFVVLGFGLGLVVPAAFTAVGRLEGVHTGTAVAAVSAIGWLGYVAGPPVIGHIADLVTLPVALGIVPLLTALTAISVRVSRRFDPAPAAEPVVGGTISPA